jgi:drug/metabolite transporter (DMT)-like permease
MESLNKSHQNNSVFFFLVIAAVLQLAWGLVPSASKFVINEIPVELYIAIRWTISGTIFCLYLLVTRQWKKISLKTMFKVSLLGIVGYGFASFGTLYGLKIGGVTNLALVGALSPMITSLVAIWILKERPSKLFLIALPMGILGLILLVLAKYQISTFAIAGLSCLCIVIAGFLEALAFVFSKKFKEQMNVAQYLAITQISVALFMWISQFLFFHQAQEVTHLTPRGISSALFVSVFACVICYAVLYWLLQHVDGHRIALFEGLHTVSATIFGCLLFQEELKPIMIVGGIFVLASVVIGNLPKNDRQPRVLQTQNVKNM